MQACLPQPDALTPHASLPAAARQVPRSERDERQAHTGGLGGHLGVGGCLLPDVLGESPGVVVVVGADDEELPPAHHGIALTLQLVRQRDGLPMRRQFGACLPARAAEVYGFRGFRRFQPLVLGLALGLGLRHRDIRALPFLLDRMPAVQRELCLDAQLAKYLAGGPLGFAGGKFGACVQEDLRVPGADNDVAPEPVADVLLHLLLGEGLPCLLNVCLAAQRYGHAPVGAVRHGATLAHAPRHKDRPRRAMPSTGANTARWAGYTSYSHLQDERDRPVVDQADLHVGTEDTGLDPGTKRPQRGHDLINERFSDRAGSGALPARAAAFARIGVE